MSANAADRGHRLRIESDPPMVRLRTLTWIGTAPVLVSSVVTLGAGGWLTRWWAWALVLLLAAPAVRAAWPTRAIGFGALLVIWLVARPDSAALLALTALGWHTALAVWLLSAQMPASTILHRGAVRRIGLRWLWIQAATQVVVGLVALTGTLGTDPVTGTLGVLALLALGVGIGVAAVRIAARAE